MQNNCLNTCIILQVMLSLTYQLKQREMTKAFLNNIGNMTFLGFFNSKEVYSIKGFDTQRKAENYAKKYGYEIHYKLPEGIEQYYHCN